MNDCAGGRPINSSYEYPYMLHAAGLASTICPSSRSMMNHCVVGGFEDTAILLFSLAQLLFHLPELMHALPHLF